MSRSALVLSFALAAFAAAETHAQDRQAANREIYLYQGADRAQRLLAEAKKEGGLTLYTTMTPEDAGPLVAAFEEKYGIKLRIWRGINQKLVQRARYGNPAPRSAAREILEPRVRRHSPGGLPTPRPLRAGQSALLRHGLQHQDRQAGGRSQVL